MANKMVFVSREGSLILASVYTIWGAIFFIGGFNDYMAWGISLVMLILIYRCLKGFSFKTWDFKEDLKMVNKDLISILFVYGTLLLLIMEPFR